ATLAQKISNWYNNVPGEATTFGGAASTGLSVAYAALNVAVVIGDLATAGKDDSNDADLRRWRTFSNGFGMYATPAGWISLFSDALVSQLPQQPNYPAAARLIKKAALCAYNSSTSFGQPSYSTFRICNFSVNSSGASGGALACLTDNLQIEDCRFEGNRT